jgi:hypothetical protein
MTARRQESRRPRRAPIWLLGVGALFSGAALVAHITTGISLPLALVLTGGLVTATCVIVWRHASTGARAVLRRGITAGAISGATATVAYDLSKAALSHFDSSTYNPFEAIRVFGTLLTGGATSAVANYVTGGAYHLLNGTAFGVAFAVLLGRRGAIAGIAWGLGLECFQLTLYPGWLGIRQYREFVQYSALGHVCYGAVLGLVCRHLLVSADRTA